MELNPILPHELITEILSRLPVKSLLKFKSVSKSWLSLISSPEFIKNHVKISANNKNYTHHSVLSTQELTQENTTRYSLKGRYVNSFFSGSVTESFNFEYPAQSNWLAVAGSANGLICISYGVADFILWNPLIRASKRLPYSRVSTNTWYKCNHGFGYDEFNDDYNVVSLVCIMEEDVSCVEGRIYSLKNDSWSNLDDRHKGMPFASKGFMVKGKLHWDSCYSKDIISLGLADREWGRVEKPPREEQEMCLCMGELGGDLVMVYKNRRSHNTIWVMKEYGVRESWTKMYTIKHQRSPEKYLLSCIFSPPFVRSSKGEILLVGGLDVMIYNPEDESIGYPEIVNRLGSVAQHICIESLVCPNLLSGQIPQQE